MPCYTDLQRVIRALDGQVREFDWLITDLECNWYPQALQPIDSDWFFTGPELSSLVMRQTDAIQFSWAVLTGLERGTQVDLTSLPVSPGADGNGDLWRAPPSIQHPDGLVEIVCWDSTSTLLITSDADLTRRFRAYFPEARDLEEYNAAR